MIIKLKFIIKKIKNLFLKNLFKYIKNNLLMKKKNLIKIILPKYTLNFENPSKTNNNCNGGKETTTNGRKRDDECNNVSIWKLRLDEKGDADAFVSHSLPTLSL